MTLASFVGDQFAEVICERGEQYFCENRVRIEKCEQGRLLIAFVRGTELYRVELERQSGALVISCTCPYFTGAKVCKHVWATILAADKQHMLQPVTSERVIVVAPKLHEWDLPGKDEAIPVISHAKPSSVWGVPGRASGYKSLSYQSGKPFQPDWRTVVSQLPAGNPVVPGMIWPEATELLYCIDPVQTLITGTINLDVRMRNKKKNGEWSGLKTIVLVHEDIPGLPNPDDRQILFFLKGADVPNGVPYNSRSTYCIPGAMTSFVLPMVCATGRCFYYSSRHEAPEGPLTFDAGGAPWTLRLEVVLRESDGDYSIRGQLERAGETRSLADPVMLLDSGWVFWKDHIDRLDHVNAFEWIVLLREEGEIIVPRKEISDLPAVLAGRKKLPPISMPDEISYDERQVIPKIRLVVRKAQYHTYPANALTAKLSFEYEDFEVAPDVPGSAICIKAKRILIKRDIAAEQDAVRKLNSLGLTHLVTRGLSDAAWALRPSQLPKIVPVLLGLGWTVQAEGKTYRRPGSFKVDVNSGLDWFELRAKVDFEGVSVDLPALLQAIRNKDHFITLDDGTVGILPEEWLRNYGMIAKLGQVEDDAIKFRHHQAGLLDALLATQPEANCDETFIRIRSELKSFDCIKPAVAPPGFTGKLRDYQADGLGWLHFLRRFGFGGCLADDMGLGKTIQVLALLEGRRAEWAGGRQAGDNMPAPSLVVVPRSLVFNWMQEAARFTPGLRLLDHTHPERERQTPDFSNCDLVLVTYGVLCRDILLLKEILFDYVILDEAQAIKNASAQTAKAARLLQCRYRLAMSGTPVQNHLGELWSLFEFLNPGILGSASVFNSADGFGRNPSPESRTLLAKALRPFILRRTKGQVAKELPERTDETLYCELEPKQRKLYDELRDHYKVALLDKVNRVGMGKSKIQIIEALLRLRQVACHPGLIDKKRVSEPCAKLDALLPQLVEVLEEGHKALVFSQFTSFLDIVRKQLKAKGIRYEYLDGQTTDRQTPVERFQTDPDSKLFLISLKAGGLGLNLTAAEYVFLLDPWWNPAIETQAIDRAHRLGQTRKVFAYRLIARDTVEEKVLELQKTKKELADSIINADSSLIRTLTKDDLRLLLE